MKIAIIFTLLFAATLAKTVFFCEVPVSVDDTTTVPSITLASRSYSWDNFNLVSFDSFSSRSGDVQGRAAIRNTMDVAQYSYAYEICSTGVSAIDVPVADALVCGGDATMVGGQTYPLGDNMPHSASLEGTFVGGVFTYSQTTVNRDTTSSRQSVLNDFDSAQAYYTALQAAFAGLASNGHTSIQYQGMDIYCDTNAANQVFEITGTDISSVTYYTLHGCDPSATLIFNVIGTDAVHFSGDKIYHRTEKIVFNIQGSGRQITVNTEVDGNILAPHNNLNQNSLNVGLIVVGNVSNVDQINRVTCRPPAVPNVPSKCVGFETSCTGLTNSVFSFLDMNVISFGNFVATTSDIEGRLAAAGNCVFGEGYSVGAALSTVNSIPDLDVAYSVVCGGDITWTSGALYPQGDNILAAGNAEGAYVVGQINTPFNDRVTHGSDLTQAFADAKTCYEGYSNTMANLNDNTAHSVYWSGLFVTCNDANADQYVLSVTPQELAGATYAVTDKCNFQARWIINVRGTGDVTFTGDTFPAIPGGVVYNVIGQRTVFVHDTLLGGHLLAPDCALNQSSGVIVGKVIVGNVLMSAQINREDTCPDNVTVTIQIVCSATAAPGSLTAQVAGASNLRRGDRTDKGEIVSIAGNLVTFDYPLVQGCSAGSNVGTVYVASTAGRGVKAVVSTTTSSASTFAVATAAIAVAALVL